MLRSKTIFSLLLLLPINLLSIQPYLSFKDETSNWTFLDKKGNQIILQWCGASELERVRPVFVEAYMNDELYKSFSDVSNAAEGRKKLNTIWDLRKEYYRVKLESNPPSSYLAIAKKNSKIIGFVVFDTDHQSNSNGSSSHKTLFPPEEVVISPIAIIPEAQGLGIGKELVFSIIKRFPKLKKISLSTTKTIPAAKFYRHLGFKEIQNKKSLDQIDDPKLRETIVFYEWVNPNLSIDERN